MSIRFFNEMRRHFYTTPSSYLDLLKLYDSMLSIKKEQTITKKLRIANGLKVMIYTQCHCSFLIYIHCRNCMKLMN